MSQNNNKPLLPNEGLPGILAEDPTLQYPGAVQEVVPTVTNGANSTLKGKVHVNDEGVNWVYNPADGSWSLNNKGENLKDGFYNLTRTDDMIINGNTTMQVYYDLDIYYFDKDGKMVTGWVNDTAGNTFFFENTPNSLSQGKMTQGAVTIQGDIYFFEYGTGIMLKNQSIDGYYFGPDGKLTNPH